MSLSRICRVLAVAMPILLAACQAPNGSNHAIGSIIVDAPNTRDGQIFKATFDRYIRLYRNPDQHYRLSADLASESEETSTTMTVAYELYDMRLGEAVLVGDISAFASFGGVSSLYSLEAAKQFADQRLATQLADRLYYRLLAFFGKNP